MTATLSTPKAREIQMARQIVKSVGDGNIAETLSLLSQLQKNTQYFPQKCLVYINKAIETGNYNMLSSVFTNAEYLGKDDHFIFIAPYANDPKNLASTKLTAVFGWAMFGDYSLLNRIHQGLVKEFGSLNKAAPTLPYELIAGAGHAGIDTGEVLMPAERWQFDNSHKGLSLMNVREQNHQHYQYGDVCMREIWHPTSYSFLNTVWSDAKTTSYLRNLICQVRQAASYTGQDIECKVKTGLFGRDPWKLSIEESRTEGIALEFAMKELSLDEAAKLVAIDLVAQLSGVVQGREALYYGGDYGARLLYFNFLWESGEIGIKNGKLWLRDASYKGLLRAVKPLCRWSMNLTRRELRLKQPYEIYRLYGSIAVHSAVEAIFQGFVAEPSKHLYTDH